jgi:hypothetical protein
MANKTAILLAAIAVLLVASGLLYSTGHATVGPTWSELSLSANSGDPGNTVTLSVMARSSTGLKSAALNVSAAGGTWNITDSQSITGSESLVTFRYTIPNYAPGTLISLNIVISDINGNKAPTTTKTIEVTDSVPPQILEQNQGADNVVVGGALLLSSRVSDNYQISSVSFVTNETGTFKPVRTYSFTGKDAAVSMSWSNPAIKEGTYVGWYVIANDSSGNVKTSETLVFNVHGCPVCLGPSEWSNCEVRAGKASQAQIYYECNENTNFACVLRTRSQNCTPGVVREDAKSALDAAALAITVAQNEQKDTHEAESLLADAQSSYDKGDWAAAKNGANQALNAAQAALPVVHPAPNYLPYVAGAILIAVAMGILLRFGKIRLPSVGAKPAEEQSVPKESGGKVCEICGRTFDTLYKCAECGREVCYDDSRTYEGKVYCTDDLRKRGLL